MTIDDFFERTRAVGSGSPARYLVYTTGSKEFFHGEVIDASSGETLLLRQSDGNEVLIMRRHIVAVMVAAG